LTEKKHKWRDVAWKKVLVDGVQDALIYFMPDLASDMDPTREIISIIDKEHLVKDSDTDKGMRISDLFFNVPVKGGQDWSVACLVEQQDSEKKDFAASMFDSVVRLRAARPEGRVTGFAIYTGDSKDVNFYTEMCYGLEHSVKFRTFHIPSYPVKKLQLDNRPFARVIYAGLRSYESQDNVALREKYALELLTITDKISYDKS
jgi:hypothetical protein